MLLITGIVIGWWLILVVAVGTDAEKRGKTQWWTFATLLFGLFAVILYLIYRDNVEYDTYRCDNCKSIYYSAKGADRHEKISGHVVKIVPKPESEIHGK